MPRQVSLGARTVCSTHSVDDATCQIDGLNPFGRITSGSLALSSTVFQISLSQRSITRRDTEIRQPIESKPDAVITEDCALIPYGTTLRRAKDGDGFIPFSEVPVLCMLLGRHARPSTSDDPTGGDWYYSLILGDSGRQGSTIG
jgi:hypothetical protein